MPSSTSQISKKHSIWPDSFDVRELHRVLHHYARRFYPVARPLGLGGYLTDLGRRAVVYRFTGLKLKHLFVLPQLAATG